MYHDIKSKAFILKAFTHAPPNPVPIIISEVPVFSRFGGFFRLRFPFLQDRHTIPGTILQFLPFSTYSIPGSSEGEEGGLKPLGLIASSSSPCTGRLEEGGSAVSPELRKLVSASSLRKSTRTT